MRPYVAKGAYASRIPGKAAIIAALPMSFGRLRAVQNAC